MILSVDTEKAFNKNPASISDKTPPESGHRGNLPQYNKGHK